MHFRKCEREKREEEELLEYEKEMIDDQPGTGSARYVVLCALSTLNLLFFPQAPSRLRMAVRALPVYEDSITPKLDTQPDITGTKSFLLAKLVNPMLTSVPSPPPRPKQ